MTKNRSSLAILENHLKLFVCVEFFILVPNSFFSMSSERDNGFENFG